MRKGITPHDQRDIQIQKPKENERDETAESVSEDSVAGFVKVSREKLREEGILSECQGGIKLQNPPVCSCCKQLRLSSVCGTYLPAPSGAHLVARSLTCA